MIGDFEEAVMDAMEWKAKCRELEAELAELKAKAAVPDINQLIEVLERVRLSDEEAKRHGNGSTYWNNAVLACQIAIRDELAAVPAPKQSDVHPLCRERLRVEGKAYPRSGCEVCGKWSPKSDKCRALLGGDPENSTIL